MNGVRIAKQDWLLLIFGLANLGIGVFQVSTDGYRPRIAFEFFVAGFLLAVLLSRLTGSRGLDT